MVVTINRHKCRVERLPGGRVAFHVGVQIDTETWGMDVIPRCGDVVTAHPDGELGQDSWTGTVTGVQHVLRLRHVPVVVVTVRDDKERE